jgi:hypothetical protein
MQHAAGSYRQNKEQSSPVCNKPHTYTLTDNKKLTFTRNEQYTEVCSDSFISTSTITALSLNTALTATRHKAKRKDPETTSVPDFIHTTSACRVLDDDDDDDEADGAEGQEAPRN